MSRIDIALLLGIRPVYSQHMPITHVVTIYRQIDCVGKHRVIEVSSFGDMLGMCSVYVLQFETCFSMCSAYAEAGLSYGRLL